MKSKEEVLAEMGSIVGMTSVKVYIHLVEMYITVYEHGKPDGEVWMIPDVKFICKELGLKSKEFYKILINLVANGFVQSKKVKGRLRWRPSFNGLDGII